MRNAFNPVPKPISNIEISLDELLQSNEPINKNTQLAVADTLSIKFKNVMLVSYSLAIISAIFFVISRLIDYNDYKRENKVFVWSKFAYEKNDIGKTYSYQFRNFCGVDQVNEVIKLLTEKDENRYTSRRAIINLYNVSELNEMSIPPCIATIQFNVYWQNNTKYLSTTVNQRSADFCLGVPYDVAEMALLSHIIGVYTDAKPKDLTVFYSNVHVYQAHVEELKLQLQNPVLELPTLIMNDELIKQTKPEHLTEEMFDIINVQKGRPIHKYELF